MYPGMIPISMDSGRIFCRLTAAAGIAAPVLFTLVAGTLGLTLEGYDPLTRLMSELGETGAPTAGIMNTLGFGVTGLLMVLFSLCVDRFFGRYLSGRAGAVLVAISGISFLGMAVFSCDRGCIPVTNAGQIHIQLGLAALVAAVAAAFLLGYRMREDGNWHGYWQYSLLTGILVIGVLPVFLTYGHLDGLLQRVLVGLIFFWMEVLAIRLFLACHAVS